MAQTEQHTPGPWVAERCGPGAPDCWNVTAHLGLNAQGIRTIRTIDQVLDYGGPEEAEANARLIAAAPDLLGAGEPFARLGWVGDLSDDHEFDAGFTVGDIRRLRAAIAKARGEQP